MSYDLERDTDVALAQALQSASEHQLRALHEAAGREERRLADAHLADVTVLPRRLRLARLLRQRAEIELGARGAIRAGGEACPLRDEPVGVRP